jgi:hypothetical protein
MSCTPGAFKIPPTWSGNPIRGHHKLIGGRRVVENLIIPRKPRRNNRK